MLVKDIARKGRTKLVEYVDEEGFLQRSYVPYDSVAEGEGGEVYCPLAPLGIPYGLEWGRIAHPSDIEAGKQLQEKLRRLNIWTLDDLKRNPSLVGSVGLGFSVRELLVRAETYLQQGVEHG